PVRRPVPRADRPRRRRGGHGLSAALSANVCFAAVVHLPPLRTAESRGLNMGVRYSWLILVLAALPIAGERAESPLPKFEDRLALPDGRLVDCPPSILAATGAAEVRCFATSLEFRDLKKRVSERSE